MTPKDRRRELARMKQSARVRELQGIMRAVDKWMEEGRSRDAAIRTLYRAATLPAVILYKEIPKQLRPGMSPSNLARLHRAWTASGRDISSLENRSYRSKS